MAKSPIVARLRPPLLPAAREQKILRVKGYIAVQTKPMRLLVQAVGERVRSQFDRPLGDHAARSQLVLIRQSMIT